MTLGFSFRSPGPSGQFSEAMDEAYACENIEFDLEQIDVNTILNMAGTLAEGMQFQQNQSF